NVHLIAMQRVGNHALAPLEIESGNEVPVDPSVSRAPRRRLKADRVEDIWIFRVDRDVVDVAILLEYLLPGFSPIFREKDSTTVAMHSRRSGPGREIQPIWRLGIDSKSIRSVRPLG